MSHYLVQAGTALNRVSHAGVVTAITLPTGITLYGTQANPCRAAMFSVNSKPVIVIVNGGTHDFWIDELGTCRTMQISAPISAPTATASAGAGALSGVYKVWVSFLVKDDNGATIWESGLSPASAATSSLVSKDITLGAIPVSADGIVNARRLYRSLSGGSVPYAWFDIDNNATLTEERGIADASLSILPSSVSRYGAPPDLKLICAWKERLWASSRLTPDNFRWTEEKTLYGWSTDNEGIAPPIKTDLYGITAFIPRRDELGIGLRGRLYKIVGSGNQSFQRLNVSETIGPINQESVVVKYNTAYFMSTLGPVEWTDDGLRLIGLEQVDAWFTGDTFFNRAMLQYCQARYNFDNDSIEFLMAATGSTNLDRWVSYCLRDRTWLGPHKTDAFTPTCAATDTNMGGTLIDDDGLPVNVFGSSSGYVYKRNESVVTDDGTAVTMSIELPKLHGGEPDVEKVWLEPTIHTRAETGGAMVVTAAVGDLDAADDPGELHDLRLDRERLPRLGIGRYLKLTLSNSQTASRPRIFGIEIPYFFLGRR